MRYAKFGLALALLSAGCSFKDGEILAAICKKAGEKISNMSGNAPAHLTNSVRDSMGEASLAGACRTAFAGTASSARST